MLPCRATCPNYTDGCHKSCPAWAARRTAIQEDCRRRREYLSYYSRLCADIERRCSAWR